MTDRDSTTIRNCAGLSRWMTSAANQKLRLTELLSREIALLQEHRQELITAAVTRELDVAGRMAGLRYE